MKKTTRRGAYAKARKNQMVIRRNPIVETYKYQTIVDGSEDTVQTIHLGLADPIDMLPVDAFMAGYKQSLDVPRNGLSTSANVGPTCKGRDIFSKMVAMKMKFSFPENDYLIRHPYTPPIVYHGWVKKTLYQTTSN